MAASAPDGDRRAREYAPVWSPDGKHIAYAGTRRGVTDRETTMEDTHVWIMDSEGEHRREIGGPIDARQGHPEWSADGGAVYFTAQQRGSVHLARIPISPTGVAGPPQVVVNDLGIGRRAFRRATRDSSRTRSTPRATWRSSTSRPALTPAHQATDLNADVLKGKQIADVDSLTFVSNDNKFEVEAFLVQPLGLAENPSDTCAATKYPLIVEIHGGPHGQNGPAFNFQDQVYAAHGWATLHVNYRGSTGYGQKFADARLRRSGWQRRAGRALRGERRRPPQSVDRSRAHGHRRRQLRRPAQRLAHHADQ